jgi:uncharacterized NAD(P)/FAD-binding protein YdhS
MTHGTDSGTVEPGATGTVCLIGVGPRGLSVLERICANLRQAATSRRVAVHLVDPCPPGAGQVWRTGQHRELLMNTVASQVTMFTDASVDMAGPRVPGPGLYEWARFVTLVGPLDGYREDVLAEARELGPESYPTRAFYGHYLRWVFQRVLGLAPDRVRVRVHRSHAVAMTDGADGFGGRQRVVLANGTRLEGLDAVVLAQGHRPIETTAYQREVLDFAARHGLRYVLPANAADVDLSAIRPGETVALRGLGLNFFDHLALLTLGRGGAFHRRAGRLVYQPSGREPRLVAGSRRGVPYHARGRNEKGAHGRHVPLALTPEVIGRLRAGGAIDFRRDLWPLIAKEAETVYYAALLAGRPDGRDPASFRAEYLAVRWGSPGEARVLDAFGIEPEQRWDWSRLARPYGTRRFADQRAFHDWLLAYLARDVAAAHAGNVSDPTKAALDVLRDLRNEIRLVVDHGGLTGSSHRDDLDGWYTPLNAYLSIGPPASRVEEAIALIEAGVLTVVGPDIEVRLDADRPGFAVRSPRVPGSRVYATTLVEARLPEPDLRSTTDPLLRQLLASGQCRAHRIADPDGRFHETGGLAVTGRPYRLVDRQGRAHPRRFAFGVPTESVHWVTAAGIRPGVNSVTLADADAIAREVIELAVETAGLPAQEQRVT